jgi:hypothetical protein
MTRILLGRNQTVSIDGQTAEGTREVDIDIGGKTFDITSWEHKFSSTLVVSTDVTIKLLIYWKENFDKFANKFNVHPPERMTLGISGAGSWPVIPSSITIKQPIAGTVAWEVTCKLFIY